MIKYLTIVFLIAGISCRAQKSVIQKHVNIDVSTFESENKTKASAMPEIKATSKLKKYKRRFDYLLVNISEIHHPEKSEERNAIFNLYPDRQEIKKRYLEKYIQDKKLVAYFEETMAPINDPHLQINKSYAVDELMEVASKFFYADKVKPDTTVQSHVCIGINGMKETRWEKDYTLLAAFCYEAIFNNLDEDSSHISESYRSEKRLSCEQYRKNITTLDKYLEDVKWDLFDRMKNNAILKEELLKYYELNKHNLAFNIVK
ncbi:MAG: hypothetical protein K0S53_1973 [Bacteroidetes bacterium]|jgi:hypothetical protein|nr:hypothetical protein [Bacteroidota bacterium]MDF2451039.1 hypothetical protein [Bacteroidota bacterium]